MLITNKKLSGFTLLELIVVIAIIAILAVIAIPSFTKAINEAKSASIKANMKLAMQEIMKEQANNGGVVPGLQECGEGTNLVIGHTLLTAPVSKTVNGITYNVPFSYRGGQYNCNLSSNPYTFIVDSITNPVAYSQKYFDTIQKIASSGNYLTDIQSYHFFITTSGKDKFANYIYLPNYKLLCIDNQGQVKEYEIISRTNFSIYDDNGVGITNDKSFWNSTKGVCF